MYPRTSSVTRPKTWAAVPMLLLIVTILGACANSASGGSGKSQLTGGTVMEKQARFDPLGPANCPQGQEVDQSIYVDASLSSRSKRLNGERLVEILATSRVPSICGGHLRIVMFARSIAGIETVIDTNLDPGHGTYASQVIKADKAIEGMVERVRMAMAKPSIETRGTDIVGVLRDAAETRPPRSSSRFYKVLVITDGEATGALRIGPKGTVAQATKLARAALVPDLTGADVRFVGVGVLGRARQPATSHVTALKALLQTLCNRATRATCPAPTTNYTQ